MARTSQERKRTRASRGRGRGTDEAREALDDTEVLDDEDGEEDYGDELDSDDGFFSTLKHAVADAAIAVLKPVAERAATKAAKFAVEKGPQVMEETVLPKIQEA